MDLLQFFDREDEKYAELYENVLSDSSFLNDDVNKVIFSNNGFGFLVSLGLLVSGFTGAD